MSVEQTLTDELRVVADSVQPPPPPIAELVRQAEQNRTQSRRTRLAGTALVAAAVVGAIVIGTQVGRQSTAPPPANPSPSPSYYAPGVPYVLGRTLYIDHQPQPGLWINAVTVGEYTAVLRSDEDGAGTTAVILHNGVEVDIVPDVFHGPEFSPGGTKLAWFRSTDDRRTGTLVVRDLTTMRDLGSLVVPLGWEQGNDPWLRVEDDGTVYYNTNFPTHDRNWAWKPGGTRTRAPAPDDGIPNPPAFQEIQAIVRLSPDHLWGAWLATREGAVLVEEGTPGDLTVQKPGEPGSRFTIPVTGGISPGDMAIWDSPTQLVIVGESEIRCDIVERWCRDS